VTHMAMVDWVEDDDCRAVVIKKHCDTLEDVMRAPRRYRDDENEDPSHGITQMCDRSQMSRLADPPGHLHDITRCTINGMVRNVSAIAQCGLTPSGFSPTDQPAPLAYAILAHKSAGNVGRLVNAVWHEGAVVAVHVDPQGLTVDEVKREIHHHMCGSNSTCVLPEGVAVFSKISGSWGTISIFDMLHECVARLLRMSTQWSHVINLSESDYPLTTQAHLRRFLSSYGKGVNFMDIHDPAWQLSDKRWRGREVFAKCHGSTMSVHLLKAPSAVRVYDGSMWTMMTRDFWVEMIDTEPGHSLLQYVRDYAVDLDIPDEAMQQTLLMASRYCTRVCNTNMRWENWKGGSSPEPFNTGDIKSLFESRSAFARKFGDDAAVIKQVEEMIGVKPVQLAPMPQ